MKRALISRACAKSGLHMRKELQSRRIELTLVCSISGGQLTAYGCQANRALLGSAVGAWLTESERVLGERIPLSGSRPPLWLTAHPRRTRIARVPVNLMERLGKAAPAGAAEAEGKPHLAGCLVSGRKWLPTPIRVSSLKDSKQGRCGGPFRSVFRTRLGLSPLCANMSETPTPFEFSVEGGEERTNGSHA